MSNLTNLDEVCVQATHIEMEGKNTKEKFSKKPFKEDGNNFKGNGKGKHTATVKKEGEKPTCTHCQKKVTMLPNVGNFIQNSSPRSFGIKKTKRLL